MKYFLIVLSVLAMGMGSSGIIPLEIDTSDQAPITKPVVESVTLFELFDILMQRIFSVPTRVEEPASPARRFCDVLGWRSFPHIDERSTGSLAVVEDSVALDELFETVAVGGVVRPHTLTISAEDDLQQRLTNDVSNWSPDSALEKCRDIISRYIGEFHRYGIGMLALCINLQDPTYEEICGIYASVRVPFSRDESFVLIQLYSHMYTNLFGDAIVERIEANAIADGHFKWEVTAGAFEYFVMMPQTPFATLQEIADIRLFTETYPNSGIVALFFAGLRLNAGIFDIILQQPTGSLHVANAIRDPLILSATVYDLLRRATSIVNSNVGQISFTQAIELMQHMAPYFGRME